MTRSLRRPPPTAVEREQAAAAHKALAAALDDKALFGKRQAAFVSWGGTPRRSGAFVTWSGLPGFTFVSGEGYSHSLLPGWAYQKHEVRSEMLEDLRRLAELGERPRLETVPDLFTPREGT